MKIFRYTLLGFSASAALMLVIFWTVSGRSSDIVLFIFLTFLIANAFYIFISRPTVKASDIIARASTGLALVSLKLHYQSQEAQIKELEAEKRRRTEEERNRFKLQVAKDILNNMHSKLLDDKQKTEGSPQLTSQARQKTDALALPYPISIPAENVRLSNGYDAGEKPTQPIIQASPVPPPTASK